MSSRISLHQGFRRRRASAAAKLWRDETAGQEGSDGRTESENKRDPFMFVAKPLVSQKSNGLIYAR